METNIKNGLWGLEILETRYQINKSKLLEKKDNDGYYIQHLEGKTLEKAKKEVLKKIYKDLKEKQEQIQEEITFIILKLSE